LHQDPAKEMTRNFDIRSAKMDKSRIPLQSFRLMFDEIKSLYKYRYLLWEMILRNIKNRYKRSILGIAWTMINPLLTMLVMAIVFSQLFAVSLPRYPVYLLCGLLLWNFFSQTTVAAIRDLVWGSSLLKRIYIPKALFATAAAGTGMVNLLLAIIPLGIIALFSGSKMGLPLLFVPIALILAFMFSLGIGLGISTQAVFFADVLDMYQIALIAWMYLTPIFYPVEIMAPKLRWIIYINPLYYIVECFREPIYLNKFPSLQTIFFASLSAGIAMVVGSWIFARKSTEFTYYV
jgi:ABC-type polysaccharide/polyol phosphate export permease